MDTFEEGIKIVKYFIEDVDDYKIHIYFNDYEEKKLVEELLNNLSLPSERYFLHEKVSEYVGENKSLHIFYERKHFYGINADATSHHFRLGLALPVKIITYFINKYKNFKLMENGKLESGMQNKVFYIELIIKEAIKNKTNKEKA